MKPITNCAEQSHEPRTASLSSRVLYPIHEEEADPYADMQARLDATIADREKAIDAEPPMRHEPITAYAERPRSAHVMGMNQGHRERTPPKRFSRWGKR